MADEKDNEPDAIAMATLSMMMVLVTELVRSNAVDRGRLRSSLDLAEKHLVPDNEVSARIYRRVVAIMRIAIDVDDQNQGAEGG